jgi:iron complex transport system substrate-binding protein
MRLVSLCPSNTEILFALGLGEHVVGVDDWSDWPDEVRGLPRVGGDLTCDLDRVEALGPDLVLASLSVPGMERNVEGLEARGLPHLVLNPRSLDDVLEDILETGRRCGATLRAEAIVRDARSRIERVRAGAAARPPVRVYWEWWPKPLIAAGGASWVDQMSRLVGARNVFDDVETSSRVVTDAEVLERDPELLMICWCGTLQRLQEASRVRSRPGWDAMSGVREGRIRCVPEALFGRPSQRLLEGLDLLDGIVLEATSHAFPEGGLQ